MPVSDLPGNLLDEATFREGEGWGDKKIERRVFDWLNLTRPYREASSAAFKNLYRLQRACGALLVPPSSLSCWTGMATQAKIPAWLTLLFAPFFLPFLHLLSLFYPFFHKNFLSVYIIKLQTFLKQPRSSCSFSKSVISQALRKIAQTNHKCPLEGNARNSYLKKLRQ